MSDLKNNTAASQQNINAQADVGTIADVEAVMKKYDRESNTRIWTGIPQTILRLMMVAFSAYCIYVT